MSARAYTLPRHARSHARAGLTIRGGGNPLIPMAFMPRNRLGPPPRSFAADAHDCIMVRVSTDPTEYKVVARASAPAAELPSDRPDTEKGPANPT